MTTDIRVVHPPANPDDAPEDVTFQDPDGAPFISYEDGKGWVLWYYDDPDSPTPGVDWYELGTHDERWALEGARRYLGSIGR